MSIERQQLTPGEALLAAGLGREALPYLLEAHEASPSDWRHLSNLAAAYRICGELQLAEGKLLAALEINDKSPEIWNNLSNVLADLGDFENSYSAALNSFKLLQSRHSAMQLGAELLRKGEWADGGQLYDAGRIGYSWIPIAGIPTWDGEDPAGKEILVLPEGGYGDSFWCLPFMQELVKRGAKVTYLTWPEQMDILHCAEFDLKLLNREKPFDGRGFDYQISLLSILFKLGLQPKDIVPVRRLIQIPDAHREAARWMLANGGKKKVGLCWFAEENTTARKFRSIPVTELEPLRHLDCRWINLTQQKEVPDWIETKPLTMWTDTGAMIAELDLVVTVDTAVAHLAGCLNVPCLTIVPLNVDWKWGLVGERAIWYESMSLIRNTEPLSFKPAVEMAAAKVKEWLHTDNFTQS